LHLALTKGIPFTEGPWADTWGEWVTGCAPIINPATGHIIAVLGIDINARNWLTAVARYRWFGIAISTLVLGIVVMLILGMYFQGRSNLRITQYNRELNDELTKRKLAEEALRESQRSLAEIIEFLPDATFVID
jgi:PAS domain-containing protein